MRTEEQRAKRAAARRAARAKDPEKHRAYAAAYRAANRERIAAHSRKGYQKHKDKCLARHKAWYAENREYSAVYKRAWTNAKKYALSQEAYEAILESQGGSCKICKKALAAMGKRTHLDHCHKTGRIRGILCNVCNLRLGHYEKRGLVGVLQDLEYLGFV